MVEKPDNQRDNKGARVDGFIFLAILAVGVLPLMAILVYGMFAGNDYYEEKQERESANRHVYQEPYRQAAQVAIEELNRELADDMSPVTILNTVVDFYCRAPYDAKVFDDEKKLRTYATQQWETNWRSDIIDLPYSFDAAVSERCG